jgi:hypothetical protein
MGLPDCKEPLECSAYESNVSRETYLCSFHDSVSTALPLFIDGKNPVTILPNQFGGRKSGKTPRRRCTLFARLHHETRPEAFSGLQIEGKSVYHHLKKLMYTVNVGTPDPRFGNMLLEQFGGANGELAAAMQYSIQGWNCDDPDRRDLLMDIGTEELSHLEVVGTLARMHLKPMKSDRDAAHADPLIAIAGGGGVSLNNSMGNPWTADYLKITGELDVDLRNNIAAEDEPKSFTNV